MKNENTRDRSSGFETTIENIGPGKFESSYKIKGQKFLVGIFGTHEEAHLQSLLAVQRYFRTQGQ